MKCRNCGAENVDGLERCVACGALMKEDETKKVNLLGVIAALAIGASIFLPFYSINLFGSSMSMALSDWDWQRWAPLAVLALGGLISAANGSKGGQITCGILGIAYFGYLYHLFVNGMDGLGATSDVPDFMTELAKSMLQKDIGFYALPAGSLGLVIAGAVTPSRNG